MRSRRIQLAILVYGTFAVLAVLWGVLRGNADLYHHPVPWLELPFPQSTALSLFLGVAVGLIAIVLTRVLVRRTRWARRLHSEFRDLFGPLDAREIAVFALSSGIAEELFFRGAMQPVLGLVLASVVFGALHVGPGRHFWPWTVWATLMGLIFGALFALTGELLGAVVAHVVINYENLHFINSYDPTPGGRRPTPGRGIPGESDLVSSRLRSGGRL